MNQTDQKSAAFSAALFNCADVFVMPGEAELQSIATLEAMATGLPVLAANAKALPELVVPGVNGDLFEPGHPEDLARKMIRMTEIEIAWLRWAQPV
jgi:glycosyltransferase involved in cell wall biosynthesis